MKKQWTFALVGAGEFGNFATSLLTQAPELTLSAVVDTNEAKANALALMYHVPVYTSLAALWGVEQVDFIMINTPNYTHYELAKEALQHHCAVFCEKPLVIDVSQVPELFDLASPGQLDVDMVLREALGYKHLKQQLESSLKIPQSIRFENHGTESTIESEWYWDDKRSGGWFYTAAIHFIDLVFFLFPTVEFTHAQAHLLPGKNDRPRGYIARLWNTETSFEIVHYFDTSYEKAGLTASIKFEKDQVMLQGWVPTSITWQRQTHPPFHLTTSRHEEYIRMVSRRLRQFCTGLSTQQSPITLLDITKTSTVCELLQHSALQNGAILEISQIP